VTHDQAVKVLRTLTLRYSKDDADAPRLVAARLVAALRYVADMADAAKMLSELLFDASGSSSYERWSNGFRKQVEAALAALPKEPK
jgi:hypothetical protein